MSFSKPQVKTISFEEIVKGRDATVRVTDDGLLYAVDLVMVMTGSERDYAGQVLRRLPEETFSSCKLHDRTLPGKGNANIKVLTFKDAIELTMVLPGKLAKETRTQFADIIRRHMAGDQRMHAALDANAASTSAIAQLARVSLAKESQQEEDYAIGFKRRRDELELQKLEQDIKYRAQEMRLKEHQHYRDIEEDIKRISNQEHNAGMEERTRLMLKDTYMNMLMNAQQPVITNSSLSMPQQQGLLPSPNKPISIPVVAAELGYRPSSADAKRIGMDLKKRYVAKHGKPPPKHEQLCDGRVTQVNSYTEADRELMKESVRAHYAPRGDSSEESM